MSLSPFSTQVHGDAPLLISIPHLGRGIPEELRDGYAPQALALEDTDWHLDRLYAFARDLGATVVSAQLSRYVIDLNRPPGGESLYPGQTTTSLCPLETFRGVPLYKPGRAPGPEEVARRVRTCWQPYHDALRDEIKRLRARHASLLLWEAHSIASVLPRLFPGKLPDLNFGTADGRSCGPDVIAGALAPLRDASCPWTWVLDGRFKGGFITRHYGDPGGGVHAIQLEMCQSLYMDETAPFAWRPDLAAAVQPAVRAAVEGALGRLDRRPA